MASKLDDQLAAPFLPSFIFKTDICRRCRMFPSPSLVAEDCPKSKTVWSWLRKSRLKYRQGNLFWTFLKQLAAKAEEILDGYLMFFFVLQKIFWDRVSCIQGSVCAALNAPCNLRRPCTSSPCLHLPTARITAAPHHAWFPQCWDWTQGLGVLAECSTGWAGALRQVLSGCKMWTDSNTVLMEGIKIRTSADPKVDRQATKGS